VFVSQWIDAADDQRCTTWCRNAYQALQPFVGERRYLNYMGEDDLQESATLLAAYGPNLPRLRAIKRQYDPDNVFHHNLNIPPA
jgi:FAD/FMN-containing dehydrogenase